jgi:hypothetical protein
MYKNSHSKEKLDDTEFTATNLPNPLPSSIKIKQPNGQLELSALAVI